MSDGEKDRFGDKLRDAGKAREDRFFAERDRQLLEKLKSKSGAQDEEAVRELVQARCPRCGDRLATATRLDVEIDECPKGHGLWLDAGELEKLTARESSGWLSRILGRPA